MSELLTSLQKANLLPGAASSLIPSSFTPSADLAVSFGDVAVRMGNMLRVSAVQRKPAITFKVEVRFAKTPSSQMLHSIYTSGEK